MGLHVFDSATNAYLGWHPDDDADLETMTGVRVETVPGLSDEVPPGTPRSAVSLVRGKVVVEPDYQDGESILANTSEQHRVAVALVFPMLKLLLKLAKDAKLTQAEKGMVSFLRDDLLPATQSLTLAELKKLRKLLS